ncbi:MAG TPA: tryptophan synthase subunit alpha [Vicinamibacterales bacterium]|nr:tryptophan synthase subunit alpha [Vicinamibacterales bacterium]
MSGLADTFEHLRKARRGGLVAYLTAGDPDADRSAAVLTAVARAGADVLEIGVPFSDPLADGPVIQRASERALAQGMTLRHAIALVRRVRSAVPTPIVLFTYANPILRMGVRAFASEAADAGADGVLILDLPLEEAEGSCRMLIEACLDPVVLVSPTTTDDRIRRAASLGRGFLYVISRLGVTGMRDRLPDDITDLVGRVRARTDLPVALGFGISHPDHVAAVCRTADAAVVGSALVNVVAEHAASPDLCERAGEYVRWLKSGL